MKLSKGTLDILKNFSNINPSITFKEGQELSTLSIQRNILSRAVVEEKFPRDFAIYDLSEFLSGLSLFDNPDFDFANDNYVIIKDKKCQSIVPEQLLITLDERHKCNHCHPPT